MHHKELKHPKFGHLPLSTSGPQHCALSGSVLLNSPHFNKGTAFSAHERSEFKLHGLLPDSISTLEVQTRRAYEQFRSRPTDIAKNTFMTSLKEQNQVLYYRLILDHLKEMFPIIYTPTEGEAIADYSRLFRRPEGCFLNITDSDRIENDIEKFGDPDSVDIIVVSDGEQILGIGDQGIGAVLISVAKLVIYTLCAGIHPSRTLPVVLDCGTDNENLLHDELYLGLHHPRVRGTEYDDFVHKFVLAARRRYPKAYIHFEDFGLQNARRILERYTGEFACFNDDVQGTGCVTLAALIAALKVLELRMSEVRVMIFGAGSAGTGIADQIRDAMSIDSGRPKEDVGKQIWCVDKAGLLVRSKRQELTSAQMPFAREDKDWEGKGHSNLLDVVREVKPHVLIGTSTQPGAFSEEVVREMASHMDRPIIFPLSNPTKLHEAKPQDLFEWTSGKVLCATGSPFPAVEYGGISYEIAECNNSTVFPGIGLGVVLCQAKQLTPALLFAAVNALAEKAPALDDITKPLLPDITNVRDISVRIAAAVIKAAIKENLQEQIEIPKDDAELEDWIRDQMWDARYRELVKVDPTEPS